MPRCELFAFALIRRSSVRVLGAAAADTGCPELWYNRRMKFRNSFLLLAVACAFGTVGAVDQPGVSPGPGVRYATDAYPGFDSEDEIVRPSKKEPRWFAWLTGPKMTNAADQFAWAQACEREESWGAARRGYDALVRYWPTSPEAVKAQKALADLLLVHDLDYEEAFAEYRYLLDFYSLECDYDAIAAQAYKVANLMREEGKHILFFRFSNTVDVRRAYESVVLRSPGAAFVPEALLTIAELREDEGKYEVAVEVYENLRNLYPESPEAKEALVREARVRMKILEDNGYNRLRVNDTIGYLKLAMREDISANAREELAEMLDRVQCDLEAEAYRAAKFYDSRTRTLRSAVNAYEKYLRDYPTGAHAAEVRERLAILKEGKGK